ncbi:glycosyltransferase family 2 protein [Bacteroides sp. GM023]|uniref:glycosyltransferase family 2 protein n=1 Tax=Bacteroides sp. GM023 TaxID=2723058 RepID=UPI00168B6352|nr:glycosyltransferase [Bacteroides sp. GM023]MBD3589414.1 glycosyltransferase family 2 protein [Bacteroides sp. GM023]
MKIAVLYTCFNRKVKTLASLQSVFDAAEAYNKINVNKLDIEVFLTDDGCTDGTPEAVCELFVEKNVHILKGTGNLFWTRGMCLAWEEARKRHSEWDYYLLMNDDTTMNSYGFVELLNAQKYCVKQYRQEGVISGITCSTTDPTVITYGGDVIVNRFTGKAIRLGKSSVPQMVDMANANIFMVPCSVVDKIGIFYDGYEHASADNDYSMLACRKGIPVLVTSAACGECDNEHHNSDVDSQRFINMTLTERRAYYNHPLHSKKDYLTFVRRNMPLRYPLSWLFTMLKVYCPKIYYRINNHK